MLSKLPFKSLLLLFFLLSLYVVLPNFFNNKFFTLKKRIKLGLDLKGGSSLLLDVDLDYSFKEKLSMLTYEIKEVLLTNKIEFSIENDKQVIVTLNKVDDYKKVSKLISRIDPNLEVTKKGTSIFIGYKSGYKNNLINDIITESMVNIQKRLDKLGTKEVNIQRQGKNEILVLVPGVEDTYQIKSLLGRTARLTFHLVATDVVRLQDVDYETIVILKDSFGNSYPIYRKTEVGGDSLVNVSVRLNNLGKPVVHFKFNSISSKKFAKITKENLGKPFAIVLDNLVLTVPIIREVITNGEGEISGNFTEKQARELMILLKSGALPAPLKIIEERNVGPGLGEESIKEGRIAVIISVIAVSLTMIIVYGKLGLLTFIVLVFNLSSTLLILTLFEATLTLPGIAGIALTVGMSVDANVLIFERIYEEIRAGKRTVRAIEEGFKNAIKTIFDSNITTLISSGIMFIVGTGAIRGFSITLSIGVLCSMFSSIIVTKILIESCMNTKRLLLF